MIGTQNSLGVAHRKDGTSELAKVLSVSQFRFQRLLFKKHFPRPHTPFMHTYPLVNRIISPGCIRPPISSHTEIVMLPVLSATLHDLTSWPSLVLVTRPISRTIKTTFKFFSPGLISFIKRGGSLTPFILRQVRYGCGDTGGKGAGQSFPPSQARGEGRRATLGGGGEKRGRKRLVRDRGNQPRLH